jgi:hypothetical protein
LDKISALEMAQRILISALLFVFSISAYAQQIQLRKSGKNEFSFSTKGLVLIKDIQLEGPSYHITDDAYQFKIIALTENGEPDKEVSGNFQFTVNGELKEVEFANTNVEKTMEVSRFGGTPKLLGFAVFLLLTFLFRHQLARMFRKLFGKDK